MTAKLALKAMLVLVVFGVGFAVTFVWLSGGPAPARVALKALVIVLVGAM
jgi:hypothetical protein